MYEKMNLLEFQERFATEEACLSYLMQKRWPEGFVCPRCGGQGGYWLQHTAIDGVSPMPVSGFFHRRDDFPQDAGAPEILVLDHLLDEPLQSGLLDEGTAEAAGNRKLSDGLDDGT